MTDELKPCPWCSCKTPYAASPSLGQSYWRVVCDDCGAEGPPMGKDMSAPDCDAACITAWNTRADNVRLTEARAIIGQAVQDVRHPPAPDSMQRRVERMERWLEAEKGTSHG